MITLGDLAQRLGLELAGDPGCPVEGLATLAAAGPAEVAFLSNRKYLKQLADTRAAAVIIHSDLVPSCPVASLSGADPYLAFARATAIFNNAPAPSAGVHASAVVAADAQVDAGATVGPHAVVEAGAMIAAGAVIGAGAFVGANSRVGEGSLVHPGATLYHDVHIGAHCVIHGGAVIGADGFGFAQSPDGWVKIYQLGGVRIGDRVEIGAGTTIDRGALDDTVIEDGVIIDNQVQIAHNCRIGKNTAIAGCAGLAGSTIIGANCTLAGGVGVAGHLEICDGVHVTGMTMVTSSITRPGSYSSGTPMMATPEWRRSAVRFSQLESIQRRLVALEKKKGDQ